VIAAMTHAMEHSYANVHRGLHTLANETTEAYEGARAAAARLIGAKSEAEIVFTKGATEAINLVAATFGRSLSPGDEIIVSELEHHANYVPWHFLRESRGVVLRFVPVTDDGRLDLDAYETLLGPRTRMVALTHMSNVTGAVSDVARIVAGARAVGAAVLLDGCQAVVHQRIDVAAMDVDFYVFSSHKLYGPTGLGFLYGKAERLAALPPYQGGGEMIGEVRLDRVTYAEPPHRFEAGTPPILETIGFKAAVEWLETIDRDGAHAHEMALYARVREALARDNAIRILGDCEDKGAVLSFVVENAHAHDIAQILDRYGVAVRAGTHCAEPLMRRFGVTSSARASFALYNTLAEADALVEALDRARLFFA
jgi:cysteine desulfurase/selenocysteine lyase